MAQEQQLRLISEADTASRYNVSPKTLARWRSRGIGPDYIVLPSGRVRYVEPSVDEELQKGLVRHNAA